jgi:ElaB/YqjD/DUF883 family membrane-anchored ribosome-binding protein
MSTQPIKTGKPENGVNDTSRDVEADIRQLKDDIAKLAKQLTSTSEHSYGAARRVAQEGADRLMVEGEAALEQMRAQALDLEAQVLDSVREKPYTALAIAAGVGFLFALLTRR